MTPREKFKPNLPLYSRYSKKISYLTKITVIQIFWNDIALLLLILFTGLVEKEFHIFTYGTLFVKQIT